MSLDDFIAEHTDMVRSLAVALRAELKLRVEVDDLIAPDVIAWIKRVSDDTEITMSVCTGAFILAKAGLLDGRQATTHWSQLARLRKAAPHIDVRDKVRFIDAGKIVTTAGVSAGIDGALHVVDRLSGRSTATWAATGMEYKWNRAPEQEPPAKK